MIARFFGIALALCAVFAGLGELPKLRVLLLPATEFMRVEGETLGVTSMVDSNPGHAALAGTNARVFAVEFKYAIGNAIRTANTMSPVCVYCDGARVMRITGKSPSALATGTKVAVYVAQSRPDTAYLELPQRQDVRDQVLWLVLWLIVAPIFAIAVSWHFGSSMARAARAR